MLVLTRRFGQKIFVGDDIVITIVAINGQAVRVGIEAPTEIPIYRQEVYEAIQKEKAVARTTDTPSTDTPIQQ